MKKDQKMNIKMVAGFAVPALVVLSLFGLFVFYTGWVTNVENYELCFTFDRFNGGKIETVNHQGWIVKTPFRYSVHTIDLRPYQITISANKRVLNAKLVKFNPVGLETFVQWHGRKAADNIGHDSYMDSMGNLQPSTGLLDILKCYAFDKAEGKDCPFLTILQDVNFNQAGQAITNNLASR